MWLDGEIESNGKECFLPTAHHPSLIVSELRVDGGAPHLAGTIS